MRKFYLIFISGILSINIANAQAVGIGTTSPDPSSILDVTSTKAGVLLPRMKSAERTAIASPVEGLTVYEIDTKLIYQFDGSKWRKILNNLFWDNSVSGNYIYNTTDSIGIGISKPVEKLHISNGQIKLTRTASFENSVLFDMPAATAASEHEGLKFSVANVAKGFIGYSSNSFLVPSVLRFSGSGFFNTDMVINGVGNVGIGTGSPTEKLEVDGNALISDGGILSLNKISGLKTVEIKSTETGADGSSVLLYNGSGLVTIELDADYGDGDGRVITSELQIKGGSDLAEKFDIDATEEQEIKPGMLVSIDTKNEGMLCITNEPGDKKIVGVISGANGIKPGMLMGQQGTVAYGKHPVALAGRVYVLANNEGGEIKAGDFLCSASQKGYAKKVSNIGNAQGAIIGKAMGSTDAKTGYTLVLINLQ
ncbi:MAG: hypothetical protein ABI594_19190 [Ginsengibacter sp.]